MIFIIYKVQKAILNLIFPWDGLRVNRTRLNPDPKLQDARVSLEAASDCHVVAKCLLIPTYPCFLLAPENYGYPCDDYCTLGNTKSFFSNRKITFKLQKKSQP